MKQWHLDYISFARGVPTSVVPFSQVKPSLLTAAAQVEGKSRLLERLKRGKMITRMAKARQRGRACRAHASAFKVAGFPHLILAAGLLVAG